MVFPLTSPGPIANTNIAVGWTCGICGMWVLGDNTHFCGGSTGATPQPLVINQDDEIVQKLDKIIKLLEKEIDEE